MSVRFEWDYKKAASNISKHRVSFAEALTVFGDPLARIFDDQDHSLDEKREIIIGHSSRARLPVVALRSVRSRLESLVRERQRILNEGIMKKTSSGKRSKPEDMREEYRFDYQKSRPNRFTSRMKGRTVAIVLDPDVASVFRSSESVNSLLRSVIKSLPKRLNPL